MIALQRLFQLADSAFPTGAYAFSDGLETLARRGEVDGADTLTAFMRGQLNVGWGAQDPPACALAWRAAQSGSNIAELDVHLDCLKVVAGPHEASVRVGANLARAARALWPDALHDVSLGRHHAVVFGVLAGRLGAGRDETVTALVSAWLVNRAVATTRLARLGGLDAQRAVRRVEGAAEACVARALEAGLGDLQGFGPALDLAAHEQGLLSTRLFQS